MTDAAEYQSRLWVGGALAIVTALILFLDPAPIYPFLFLLFLGLTLATVAELYHLLGSLPRQPYLLAVAAVALIHGAGPLSKLWPYLGTGLPGPEPLPTLLGAIVVVLVAVFLWEMVRFHGPDQAIVRLSLTVWIALYLGLLPSFLILLRWEGTANDHWYNGHGAILVGLAVFIPKVGDIGAYFAGKHLGRRRMTPLLSPKKTWAGLFGGLAASVLAASAVQAVYPVFTRVWFAPLFGLSVGVAGVLGDLAESLIKRDASQKDASQVVPGFGGLLDVVDSVIFAAPVAFLWLR